MKTEVLNTSRVIFKTIKLGDCEDPELYAAFPIAEWERSEQGEWAKDNATNLAWYLEEDFGNWGFRVRIEGNLQGESLTYFFMRWGTE